MVPRLSAQSRPGGASRSSAAAQGEPHQPAPAALDDADWRRCSAAAPLSTGTAICDVQPPLIGRAPLLLFSTGYCRRCRSGLVSRCSQRCTLGCCQARRCCSHRGAGSTCSKGMSFWNWCMPAPWRGGSIAASEHRARTAGCRCHACCRWGAEGEAVPVLCGQHVLASSPQPIGSCFPDDAPLLRFCMPAARRVSRLGTGEAGPGQFCSQLPGTLQSPPATPLEVAVPADPRAPASHVQSLPSEASPGQVRSWS